MRKILIFMSTSNTLGNLTDHKAVRFFLLFAVEICFCRSVDFWSWKLDPVVFCLKIWNFEDKFLQNWLLAFLSTIFALKMRWFELNESYFSNYFLKQILKNILYYKRKISVFKCMVGGILFKSNPILDLIIYN